MLTCALRAYTKKFKIEMIVLKVVHSTLLNFLKLKFCYFLWKISSFGFTNYKFVHHWIILRTPYYNGLSTLDQKISWLSLSMSMLLYLLNFIFIKKKSKIKKRVFNLYYVNSKSSNFIIILFFVIIFSSIHNKFTCSSIEAV